MINLEKRILKVEEEYLQLLQSIDTSFEEKSVCSILDSIRLFWYKNRKLVSLYLQTLMGKEAFSYSGATHLDVNDKEYYGFLAVGKIHIMDDQLYKYADMVLLGKNVSGIEIIKKQILITLVDNIKVLQELRGIIVLLPVRLFYENLQIIHNSAEKCFLSFFNNKYSSIQCFLEECKSVDDLISNISEDIIKSIFLCDNDDFNLSIYERIKRIPDAISKMENDVFKFFLSIQGFLISSLEMLEVMHDFDIIPIVRNRATLSYLYLLEPNLNNDFQYLNKIVLANEIFAIINQNRERFEGLSPEQANNVFDKSNIFDALYKKFGLENTPINSINIHERVDDIKHTVNKISIP